MGDTEDKNITSTPKTNTGEGVNQDNISQEQQITAGLEYFDSIVNQNNFTEYIVDYIPTEYWEREPYESIKDNIEYIQINRNTVSKRENLLRFLDAFKEIIIEHQAGLKRKTEENNEFLAGIQEEKEKVEGEKYKISRKDEFRTAKEEDKKDLRLIKEYLESEEQENTKINDAIDEYKNTKKITDRT